MKSSRSLGLRSAMALMRMTGTEIGKRGIWWIARLMGRIGECASSGEYDLNRPSRLGRSG